MILTIKSIQTFSWYDVDARIGTPEYAQFNSERNVKINQMVIEQKTDGVLTLTGQGTANGSSIRSWINIAAAEEWTNFINNLYTNYGYSPYPGTTYENIT